MVNYSKRSPHKFDHLFVICLETCLRTCAEDHGFYPSQFASVFKFI